MTVTWSLTTTITDRVDTIFDTAEDHDAAVTAVLAVALDAMHAAGVRQLPQTPRYELRADGGLVALIQTGTDDAGCPDHAEAASMIQRIEVARTFSASPR
ncbi:hypothetical protein [Mycolicibacterium grossiae]|uniref:Uncharacterized protein n=1 Tax=Mycolicibacterium grossiae TaxID=1552759 RepID=A0A1E8Q846_9MYCO|nr:hypothetical protein [Mycolicibacterium grossiae]OFJ54606.1 hypothetical protein BEL07_06610 [Mycolicibacterium grossiae]QEM45701.1 hypothetical protein FZ046_13830 [Mycolicibacterium grossiae]